ELWKVVVANRVHRCNRHRRRKSGLAKHYSTLGVHRPRNGVDKTSLERALGEVDAPKVHLGVFRNWHAKGMIDRVNPVSLKEFQSDDQVYEWHVRDHEGLLMGVLNFAFELARPSALFVTRPSPFVRADGRGCAVHYGFDRHCGTIRL